MLLSTHCRIFPLASLTLSLSPTFSLSSPSLAMPLSSPSSFLLSCIRAYARLRGRRKISPPSLARSSLSSLLATEIASVARRERAYALSLPPSPGLPLSIPPSPDLPHSLPLSPGLPASLALSLSLPLSLPPSLSLSRSPSLSLSLALPRPPSPGLPLSLRRPPSLSISLPLYFSLSLCRFFFSMTWLLC